ncbi:MAG: M28 family metallopeptidase [Erysipelotrichaceae bacterium]
MEKKQKHGFRNYLILLLFVLVIGITLGYHQITPTRAPNDFKDEVITLQEVTGEDADFAMTMSHVYHMAKEAHPSGSDEIGKVREYLIEQFATIGCEYQLQEFEIDMTADIEQELAFYNSYIEENPKERELFEEYFKGLGFSSYEEKYRNDIGCTNTNILNFANYLIKVDAPNNEQGILFASHYDSTTGGPGAADDLISVAAMLETLREVHNRNDLTNDMYFLFTDGEELDLFGADAFVNEYPKLKEQINLVINLEARGNSGALIMFETSLQNKNIVKALNKALAHNLMFSMTAAVYRLMPNDTDLTKFLEAGYPGINFSVLGSPENYHAVTDNYENLDLDSAYMYYQNTVSLANHFGKVDLASLTSEEDAVYFPFLKGNTIILSNLACFLFSCILGMITLTWIGFQLLKKECRLKQLLTTCGLLVLTLLGTGIIGFGGSIIYNQVMASGDWIELAETLNIIFYLLCLLSILFTISLVWRIAKKTKYNSTLLLSTLLLFNLLNWVCTLVFNSIAYIFTIPLLFVFLYSIFQSLLKNKTKRKTISTGYTIIQGIIVCLLYTPCIYLLYMALLSSILMGVMLLVGLAVIPIAVLCIYEIMIQRDKAPTYTE